jgi:hypothetical protein
MHGGTTSGVMAEARFQPGKASAQLKFSGRSPFAPTDGRLSQLVPPPRNNARTAKKDIFASESFRLPRVK